MPPTSGPFSITVPSIATSPPPPNQALNALVFLHHDVLERPWGEVGAIERADRPKRRPTVTCYKRANIRDGFRNCWATST